MKLTFILMFAALFSVSARGFGQGASLSIKMEDASLKEVLTELKNSTSFSYVYNEEAIAEVDEVNISAENASVQEILEECLYNTELTYHMENNVIIIHKRPYEEMVSTVKQEKYEIRGTVIDDQKIPLPGVSVVVKGTNIGTATDIDGNYVLKVDEKPSALVFTFVGMNQQEVAYTGQSEINVTLSADTEALSEVVVTGFQRISKERASGSFVKFKKEELEKPMESLEQSLEGNVSGLQVEENGEILLRGKNTTSPSNMKRVIQKPLIVVDGFPIEGDFKDLNTNDIESVTVLKDAAAASIWGARSANGVIVVTTKRAKKGEGLRVDINSYMSLQPIRDLDKSLNRVNTQTQLDFEKYIWTIEGENGQRFNYPRYFSKNSVTEGMSLAGYHLNEFISNRISKEQLDSELGKLSKFDNKKQIKENLLRTMMTQNHNVALATSSDKSSHRLSLTFRDKRGELVGNDSEKYTVNYNSTFKLAKWLDFNFNSSFNYEDETYNGDDSRYRSGAGSPYDVAKDLPGYYMLKDEQGNLNRWENFYMNGSPAYFSSKLYNQYFGNGTIPYEDMTYNPIEELNSRDYSEKRLNARFQGGLDITISKAFKFSTKLQYEFVNTDNKERNFESSIYTRYVVNRAVAANPDGTYTSYIPKGEIHNVFGNKVRSYNFRNQLDFNKNFGEKHRVTAIVGTEFSKRKQEYFYNPTLFGYDSSKNQYTPLPYGYGIKDAIVSAIFTRYGRPLTLTTENPNVPGVDYGQSSTGISATPFLGLTTDVYFSTYFNGAYTYNDKYTLTASARADASNFVSEDTKDKFSPFWSVGANWQLGREDFMQKFGWIDMMTVRASYGFNGIASKLSNAKTVVTIDSGSNQSTGIQLGNVSRGGFGNPSLTWEKVRALNLAVDYSFWNGKLAGKVEVYNKKTTDALANKKAALSAGSSENMINFMEISNKGIEIEINSTLPISKKISWHGSLNFSYNKNEVLKFDGEPTSAGMMTQAWYSVEGQDQSAIYGYKYYGMDEAGVSPLVVGKSGKTYDLTDYFNRSDDPDMVHRYGVSVAPYLANFNSGFRIHNFDVSIAFVGKFGHKFKSNSPYLSTYATSPGSYDKQLNRLIGSDGTKFPKFDFNNYYSKVGRYSAVSTSDLYIADASFIRIKDINIGYNLPKSFLKKYGIKSARVYGQAFNVGTKLFNRFNEDPERRFNGSRPVFTFGVRCSL